MGGAAQPAGGGEPAVHAGAQADAGPTGSGAVLAKELRTWSRDLVRTHQLTFALAYGVLRGRPLLLGWNGMLPWAGPMLRRDGRRDDLQPLRAATAPRLGSR